MKYILSNKPLPYKRIPKGLKIKRLTHYKNQRKSFKNINYLTYLMNLVISNINKYNNLSYFDNKYKEYIFNKLKVIIIRKFLKYKGSNVFKRRYIWKPGQKKRTTAANRYRVKSISYYYANLKKKFTEKSLRYYMGIVYILLTNNNTFMTINAKKKNVLLWMNGGSYGYKNTQKSTFFAAENIALKFGRLVKYTHKINNIIVKIKGFHPSRRTVIKGLNNSRLSIYKFEDITPFAHNGCRKKKEDYK